MSNEKEELIVEFFKQNDINLKIEEQLKTNFEINKLNELLLCSIDDLEDICKHFENISIKDKLKFKNIVIQRAIEYKKKLNALNNDNIKTIILSEKESEIIKYIVDNKTIIDNSIKQFSQHFIDLRSYHDGIKNNIQDKETEMIQLIKKHCENLQNINEKYYEYKRNLLTLQHLNLKTNEKNIISCFQKQKEYLNDLKLSQEKRKQLLSALENNMKTALQQMIFTTNIDINQGSLFIDHQFEQTFDTNLQKILNLSNINACKFQIHLIENNLKNKNVFIKIGWNEMNEITIFNKTMTNNETISKIAIECCKNDSKECDENEEWKEIVKNDIIKFNDLKYEVVDKNNTFEFNTHYKLRMKLILDDNNKFTIISNILQFRTENASPENVIIDVYRSDVCSVTNGKFFYRANDKGYGNLYCRQNGFRNGLHEWSIKIETRGTMLCGVISNPEWNVTDTNILGTESNQGYGVFIYSDGGAYEKCESTGYKQISPSDTLDTNDIVKIVLNCETWEITFLKNNNQLLHKKLIANKTYCPAFSLYDPTGRYSIL